MQTVNIHEAKTHLSKLIAKVVKGEPFIIVKAGKPMVRVTAIEEAAPTQKNRGCPRPNRPIALAWLVTELLKSRVERLR